MESNNPLNAATHILLSPEATSGYTHVEGLTQDSADKTSELLTLNHSAYHTRWKDTFHNHIVHHLLALWALGATPDEIQYMWDYNVPYQNSIGEPGATRLAEPLDLKDSSIFEQCLGQDKYYGDFLKYFEFEVAEKGVQEVLKEYLFRGDDRANDIFCRMYTDLVHPMIHLGCALEFKQPSLVAEALAGACVHDNWPKTFLLPTEEHVRKNAEAPTASLPDILNSLRADPVILSGVKATDPFNKIPDGFLKRVSAAQLAPYLARFRVRPTPEDLERKTAEMMYTSAYMAGAAQQPGKREKIDFVLLHSATLAVFYPAILALDWLSEGDKARLVEAKTRVDLVMYAGCGSPALYPERVTGYKPRRPAESWPELVHRSILYRDEGHAAKMIRALYSVWQLKREPALDFPIARADVLKVAHMVMDSIEGSMEPEGNNVPEEVTEAVVKRIGHGGEMVMNNMVRWVFYGGLDKAWDYVPALEA